MKQLVCVILKVCSNGTSNLHEGIWGSLVSTVKSSDRMWISLRPEVPGTVHRNELIHIFPYRQERLQAPTKTFPTSACSVFVTGFLFVYLTLIRSPMSHAKLALPSIRTTSTWAALPSTGISAAGTCMAAQAVDTGSGFVNGLGATAGTRKAAQAADTGSGFVNVVLKLKLLMGRRQRSHLGRRRLMLCSSNLCSAYYRLPSLTWNWPFIKSYIGS